jgi:DNA-directed RNA polymerase specialized sigma24 family protein
VSTVDDEFLAARFDAEHERLRAVARRVLGDGEAGDAEVDEAEVDQALAKARRRLVAPGSEGAAALDSAGGWLTGVVGRVCLDVLRGRESKRTEDSTTANAGTAPNAGTALTAAAASIAPVDLIGTIADPAEQALLADTIGRALVAALDALDPAEQLAFVLHDVFALPFDDVAADTGTTLASARELAESARRHLRSADSVPAQAVPGGVLPGGGDGSPPRHRALVAAFQAAAHRADVPALVELLDPDAVLRADLATLESGGLGVVRGARAVADACAARIAASRPASVDGQAVLVWAPDGCPRAVYRFTCAGDRVTAIDLHAAPERPAAVPVVPSS